MRKILRTPFIHATLFVMIAPLSGAPMLEAAGSGSSTPQSTIPAPAGDPERMAMDAYDRGIELRDKAADLEHESGSANEPRKQEKLMRKAMKSYENAVRSFRDATDGRPEMHQAWNELGYALRKTGDYDGSLAAYNRALHVRPGFAQAVEYRGVAYLKLGRIEEAKAAYMELFPGNRELADMLMAEMNAWLASPDTDAGMVESLGAWIEEREQIASQTSSLYTAGEPIW